MNPADSKIRTREVMEDSGKNASATGARAENDRRYWIISADSASDEVLVVGDEDSGVVPVFSFREEALLYLSYGVRKSGWTVSQRSEEEVVDLLCGPYSWTAGVALDPIPEFAGQDDALAFTTLGRREFLDDLLRSRFAAVAGFG
ncbi:Hypothetical Protein RradSPS_0945 [Rubrobacter radiotolerans]|uniref:Uncharacterized protein n=2 Tax=Rubrobacter radiotolerans TaxID=42256 RepID=A0A023X1L2_RUBRA|nr:Hypothetical Protein RradSPS_0945 [Rubrobacter radiotolerans]SMC04163.1 hypothetical protein SAMN00767673_0942 [Rubrobacter radiotolerans DSM 5868]